MASSLWLGFSLWYSLVHYSVGEIQAWLEVKMRKCSLLESLEPGIKNWIHLSR